MSRMSKDDNKNMTNTGSQVKENTKELRSYDSNKNSSISKKQKRKPKVVETQQKNMDNKETNVILKRLKEIGKNKLSKTKYRQN